MGSARNFLMLLEVDVCNIIPPGGTRMSSLSRLMSLRDRFVPPVGAWMAKRSRLEVGIGMAVLVLALGIFNYTTGFRAPFSVVYAIPVSIAAWYAGAPTALGVGLLSVAVWMGDDLFVGRHHASLVMHFLRIPLRLLFFVFLTMVLVRLRDLHRNLEELARVRALALSIEIAERERLQREMLEISEREQRRIGQDLHDSLCQHLTGTALAGQLLAQKLAQRDLPEARDARRIVDLIEDAITHARGLAHGLFPAELKSDGLMQALEEFCANTSDLFAVDCQFDCQTPVLIDSQSTAIHLYRIAQEGVGNAIKHGKPSLIVVKLEEVEEGTQLVISDNGSGLPDSGPSKSGMGLRIIADRAKMIGGHFQMDRARFGGTELTCLIPQRSSAA